MSKGLPIVLCVALGAASALGLGACDDGDDGGDGTGSADAALPAPVDAAPPGADASPVAVEYLDPDHGRWAGGDEVLLRGRGFEDGMVVRIGGRQVEALDLEVVDQKRAILRTPPGDPGLADVEVDSMGLTAGSTGAFRYEQAYLEPASGPLAGGTFVRIRGLGTAFADGQPVLLDGVPLTSVNVVSAVEITGVTPPGVGGDADLTVGTLVVADAYQYTVGADPSAGGLGGGPIMDSIAVTVVDRLTRDGVPGAFVTIGDPSVPGESLTAYTDAFGHAAFSKPGLVGPVTVEAGKPGYERGGFVHFDARELTIFLIPLPMGDPGGGGPFPPGRAGGTIRGEIVFGDVLGLGEPTWDLVPEPRSPNERKRCYVMTTTATPFSGVPTPGPGGTIDYEHDGRIAWEFEISSRPAAVAVWAIAGLYDPTIDPDGAGPEPAGAFYPFVMGAAREVLVGPHQEVEGVVVEMNIPLDQTMAIELVAPPPIGLDPLGPERHQARVYIDLGGEGVIALPHRKRTFAPGQTSVLMTGLPALGGRLADASWQVIAGAYTGEGGAPFSVRIEKDVQDLSVPLVIGDFIGVPRPSDPAPGSQALAPHLVWAPEGATTGLTTFSHHTLYTTSMGFPVWRLLARGGVRELPLYPLVSFGGADPTPQEDLGWTIYEMRIPYLDPDTVNYGHFNSRLWSAYAANTVVVRLPPP